MIGLTRRTGEHCRLDPDWIQRIEAHPYTVVHLADGAKYCVVETVAQVVDLIREDRAAVIAACYVLDRGEHPDPLGLSSLPAEAHGLAPVIPHFPHFPH